MTNNLENLIASCDEYSNNTQYVYKLCSHKSRSIKRSIKKRWLVILKKLDETQTNEGRLIKNEDIKKNSSYAKFRANKLMVIKIINIYNQKITRKFIVNIFIDVKNYSSKHITYNVGEVVVPDFYDENINKICSGGIHYFKTIVAAYYFRDVPNKYTGIWIEWFDNGVKRLEGKYSNGERDGIWKEWNETGIECINVEFKNGKFVELLYDNDKTKY